MTNNGPRRLQPPKLTLQEWWSLLYASDPQGCSNPFNGWTVPLAKSIESARAKVRAYLDSADPQDPATPPLSDL